MADCRPPYTISEKMLLLAAYISEKVGKIETYNSLSRQPHLRRNNRIRSIHSSLKIEANSLTVDEVRDIISGRPVLGPRQEIREIQNAYEAYANIKDVDPFSLKDLKRMQEILENHLKTDAGEFRNGAEGVFNGDTCIFMAPSAKLVPSLMQDLFLWMKTEKNQVHPLIMAAVFHYEFIFIHPFSDGNGRTARLWHTVLLTDWNPVFEYIPLESQIEKFQEGYYKAIADCHLDGRSNKFIEFMLERIDEILEEVLESAEHCDIGLLEYVKRMLNIMDSGVPYTASEIMAELNLKSKETFRRNYLNPAMESGLVSMTVPDKPTSRNQRYIKK